MDNLHFDIWVWININTIFRGMNIHLPAILMFTRGTRFWHTAIWLSFFCGSCTLEIQHRIWPPKWANLEISNGLSVGMAAGLRWRAQPRLATDLLKHLVRTASWRQTCQVWVGAGETAVWHPPYYGLAECQADRFISLSWFIMWYLYYMSLYPQYIQ